MAGTLLDMASLRFAQLGYFMIFLGSLAEGLSFPFPSIVLLIMAGTAVAMGKMSFWGVAILASLAYTLGAVIPYWIGFNLPKLKKYSWATRFAENTPKPFKQINDLFAKHGNKIVALSRPFLIGNCISYVAGLARMSPLKFVAYTFAGILPWAVTATLAGYFFGSNIQYAVKLVQNYSLLALGVVITGGVLYMYGRRWWTRERGTEKGPS